MHYLTQHKTTYIMTSSGHLTAFRNTSLISLHTLSNERYEEVYSAYYLTDQILIVHIHEILKVVNALLCAQHTAKANSSG